MPGAGSGPGSSDGVPISVFSQTITLTNDQIKALPTTPIVIVPATQVLNYSGLPTEMPLPIAFSVSLNPSGGAYSNLDINAAWVIALGSDFSSDGLASEVATMAQLGSSTPQIGVCNSFNNQIVNDRILALRINNGGLQDNALAIAMHNAALGDLTEGDDANTLKVTVLYIIIDV